MKIRNLNCMIWLLLIVATTATAGQSTVDGVFGLSPVTEGAAVAVWIPLENDESISGVSWYNNDGTKVFPELLAIAGDVGEPGLLDAAVVVATDVSGATLGWSEVTFTPALASATPGLFLVFRLPLDGAFESEGVGAGLGYQLGDGQVRCWIASDEGEWDLVSPEFQMAVTPIMNTDKSGSVLVLGEGGERSLAAGDEDTAAPALLAGLRAMPNPFNPLTELRFTLPADGEVSLTIVDVRGRAVRTLISSAMVAGEHGVIWNGRDDRGRAQPSGVYLALMESGSLRMTQRLTLVQ